ncbi:MAG: class I SAM-dependent methyltransferase [Ignavibacteria bacterium]|nr:class I SAM-dependent methyltransferase [Ignavibacteria bacterium]
MTPNTWYDSWFESPWYVKLYKHRTTAEAENAVQIVKGLSGLQEGSKILDLCCGFGRHSLALAECGFTVTGLDASTHLINRATEMFAHPNVDYVVGDMRGPYPENNFDAIVNFFTSFGYFDSNEENAKVIQTVSNHLKPGGLFLLDFLNEHLVRNSLVPESMSFIEGVTIIEERSINGNFVEKKITVNNPCSFEQEFHERVWLYTRDELVAMVQQCGFEILSVLGGYNAEPFVKETSPRCIVVAKKKQ